MASSAPNPAVPQEVGLGRTALPLLRRAYSCGLGFLERPKGIYTGRWRAFWRTEPTADRTFSADSC